MQFKTRVMGKEVFFWDIVNSFKKAKVVFIEAGVKFDPKKFGTAKNRSLSSIRLQAELKLEDMTVISINPDS